MKVRCIDPWGLLTKDKIYKVLKEDSRSYRIINDTGNSMLYLKERFEIVEEKPMRLDLKELGNTGKPTQELKDEHIYLIKRKDSNDMAVLFCCTSEAFRFGEEDICTFTKEYYRRHWTIIADVTDRVKISL